jgi:hypothetical protein
VISAKSLDLYDGSVWDANYLIKCDRFAGLIKASQLSNIVASLPLRR